VKLASEKKQNRLRESQHCLTLGGIEELTSRIWGEVGIFFKGAFMQDCRECKRCEISEEWISCSYPKSNWGRKVMPEAEKNFFPKYWWKTECRHFAEKPKEDEENSA